MRNFYLFIIFVSVSLIGYSQPYGNEWINYSQTYYKFPITQKGVYRLDSAMLASHGIPVTTIDPRKIQIFGRGEEQYLHIQGESDGVLNTNDYIEFFALPNDGFLDSLIYQNKSAGHPNPYYSLFNDTAFYFLTWNNSISNKRYTVETDTSFSSYTASHYFFKEHIRSFSNSLYHGETFGGINVMDAEYTSTEGWFNGSFQLGGSQTYGFNTQGVYTAGPSTATVTIRQAGESNYPYTHPNHHIRVTCASYSKDSTYDGYQLNDFKFQLPVGNLGSSFTNFTLASIVDLPSSSNPDMNNPDKTALVYAYIKYPHITDMEDSSSFEFFLPDDTSQPKSFLNLSNFDNLSAGTVLFFDLTNHKYIPVVIAGSQHKAIIPNAGNEKKCYITSLNNVRYVTSIKPAGNNGTFTDFSANAPDSAFIIVTHKSLMNEANDYKIYRNTPNGGHHHVVIADVDELYEQFAFGINKNPLAIRRFADFALDTWPSDPQNLFLLGKSLHASICRQNNTNYANSLVPSMGSPSSDNLFTAGLNGTLLEPAIPTGRLAARVPNDATIYLDKVKDFENNVPEAWMKNVLHFGGGNDSVQQNELKGYLKNYENIIEDTLYGGHVYTFLKTTSDPIQINTSDSLKRLIEGGVSLMTFFGHASGSGFDQSIDQPGNYNNKGKYPLLLANSCFAGDLHSPDYSSSEKFVIIQDKGVIGYIGSVSLGVIYALNNFSSEFYKQLSYVNYGKSIGKQMQRSIALSQGSGFDPFQKSVCLEMTLHGDPSVILNAHKLPDYAITNSDVSFDTQTMADSFIVNANFANIGRAVRDSFFVKVTRKFPNGDIEDVFKQVSAPYYKGFVSFTLPVDFSRGVGINKLSVTLDAYGWIPELSELNNTTSFLDVLLTGREIIPVYPYKYAVIPTNTVTLKASTADPFAKQRNYIFEIDTTDEFNSPFKQTTTINSIGGVVEWNPGIILTDSLVCFWRVSPDSIDTSGYRWRESSFQYIQGKRGWGQAHFFQFKNDEYQFVKHDRASRKFIFVNDIKTIRVQNGVFPNTPAGEIKYGINATWYTQWGCAWGGFNFAWIDPISGDIKRSIHMGSSVGQYGNMHCDPFSSLPWFSFGNDSAQRQLMRNFIDSVPNGHYIIAYSIDFNGFAYKTNILNDTLTYGAFEKFGSANIRTLKDTVPYIIFGKKGDPIGSAQEVIGTSKKDFILFNDTITTKWEKGFVESEVIGPAKNWGSLHWRQHALENPSDDSIVLNVIGITAAGTETVLAVFPPDSQEVLSLSTYANAAAYPYLKLKAYVKDDSLTTSPQIERWQVLYTPVPEAALNPPLKFSFYDDTLQEGDEVKLIMAIQNISEYDFTDSLLIKYWVIKKNGVKYDLPYKLKNPPFVSGAVIFDTLVFDSEDLDGKNHLWIEVNPVGDVNSQLEQYHFNNIAQLNFFINRDRINPLLDVTFDGIHILNGDIVSPKPGIVIKLKDENRFLALNDTADFAVFIRKPGGSDERIYFGPEMTFTKAVLPNNSCVINYTPNYIIDGTYKLMVQAEDRSENSSGSENYEINFEVINKSTITEILNYPNPFSTSTRFVFTLTGSEIPSIFKIQILTITGKVVREIKQDEIGPIHIGRNITQYAWDGKDEFGDRLANGIYLYRVVTQINGQSIEKRESGADAYITKGMGKMYLIR